MNEQGYIDMLKNIMEHGEDRVDRTGVGTRSIFAPVSLKFDLTNNKLPLLSSKKVPFKAVVKELLWFLKGETDANILKKQGVHIWDGNSSREFLDSRGLTDYPEGEIGPGYGFQWRNFGGNFYTKEKTGVDQIKYIQDTLISDPYSRRIFMTAWNPSDLDKMALVPCHVSAQFYVSKGDQLSCHMYQRSVDTFLGLPFNIASYAILTCILAKKCDLKPKELTISFGDAHIYNNHFTQVSTLLTRPLYDFPTIVLSDLVKQKDYSEITVDDFKVENYICGSTIKAPMAV